MTEMTPAEALATLQESHRHFYLELGHDDLVAMFILYRPEDAVFVACPMPDKPAERDGAVAAVRKIAADCGDVYMYAFVSEGWALSFGPGEQVPENIRPSQSNQRVEMVSTMVCHRDGRRLSDMCELVRDWKSGKVVALKPMGVSTMLETRFELFD